jgi:hypothetical protein
MKHTSKMRRVFKAYARHKGIMDRRSLYFILKGERVKGNETPEMLALSDGVQMDCFLDQENGGENHPCVSSRTENASI